MTNVYGEPVCAILVSVKFMRSRLYVWTDVCECFL